MQRLMLFMVTYCVYKGMRLSGSSVLDITAMQAILMLTVTTLPLPGAVGISEGMFLVVFDGIFPSELLTSAMILTRGINFYFCITVAGLITMINHIRLLRKDRKCKACTEEGIYL
jgi:hypothetical protein